MEEELYSANDIIYSEDKLDDNSLYFLEKGSI